MKIYDELIRKTEDMLSAAQPRVYPYTPERAAVQGQKNELVMASESAFELGAATFASVNFTLVTNERGLLTCDEIQLFGKDLNELKQDCSFARITIICTDDIEENGDQGAYSIIKNIDMKKYDVSPQGYMMRASAMSNREQVRVSKAAVKDGLTFEQVGNLFIGKYKENKHVLAVREIFITLPEAPFDALDKLATASVEITRALNHIIADLTMDCKQCQWKPVCDEVEGMKEMHFKMAEHK